MPGGFGVKATEIFQEGVRIPPVLICRGGVLQEDMLTLLLANMRVAEERRGDLQRSSPRLMSASPARALLDNTATTTVTRYTNELRCAPNADARHYHRCPTTLSFRDVPRLRWHRLRPIRVALELTIPTTTLTSTSPARARRCKARSTVVLGGVLRRLLGLKHVFLEVPINAGIFRRYRHRPRGDLPQRAVSARVSGSSAEVSIRASSTRCSARSRKRCPTASPPPCFGSVANYTLSGHDPERAQRYIMFRFSGGG